MSRAPTPPQPIEVTDHLWIGMPDGTRLAARLWLPVSATRDPVPALLEYIPYRKADMVRARDERNHPFLAENGFACLRVDMRGSGDSEGHMPDMYATHELSDARHVIEWIGRQPWCNGRVGMFGTSWGGTAALQAGIDAPGPLKAVIAVCATHDRFADDIHYMGGCVLSETFEWGATLPAILAAPPTPNVGADWKKRWRDRLESLPFPLEHWLAERARGPYWRHGSVVHDLDRLSVPVLAIGGWSDRYSNSVMPMVEARPDLVRGIVGPWGHHYPDQGSPGPAAGFQQIALSWWNAWLREGEGPARRDWPKLRVWLREFDPPADRIETRRGRWIETGTAADETGLKTWPLHDLAPHRPGPWPVPDDPTVGMTSGDTGYFGRPGGLPLDQARDDARSLVFETPPLQDDLILYGAATVELSLTDAPANGMLAARLNDVAPDGQVARICYGVRKLALTDDLAPPDPPHPAGPRDVTLPLHTTAYRVRKGHRLRLAVSSALWPLVWGSLDNSAVMIDGGQLHLPCLPGPPPPARDALPAPTDQSRRASHDTLAAPALERHSTLTPDGATSSWHRNMTKTRYRDTETTFGYETRVDHALSPAGHSTHVLHRMVFERPDGTADILVSLNATSAQNGIVVHAELTCSHEGQPIFGRTWELDIPR